ncbi:hypothetical protein [Vagococcus salmoninarum]|uniref:hypothetical protein n=1 Tax=Vagococcus salmoninarum TaxID=2739 RepID=UPI00398B829A
MANEITKLLDAITPEQYTTYTNTKAEEHSAFIQSGILVPTPNLDQMIVAGGKLVTMPEWSKTSLTDQVLEEDTALELVRSAASLKSLLSYTVGQVPRTRI